MILFLMNMLKHKPRHTFHLIRLPFNIFPFLPLFHSSSYSSVLPVLFLYLFFSLKCQFFSIFLNIIRFYAPFCSLVFLFHFHVLLSSLPLLSSSFLTLSRLVQLPFPPPCPWRARPTHMADSDTGHCLYNFMVSKGLNSDAISDLHVSVRLCHD
jgi:hypothetical protein